MTKKQMQSFAWWSRAMASLGLTDPEMHALRRIEMTLHRWHELECGTGNEWADRHVERDEKTGAPFLVSWFRGSVKPSRTRIPDRERGALKRLAKLMSAHPDLWSYVQGDCRGGALYVGRKADLREGETLDAYYLTRGVYCNF